MFSEDQTAHVPRIQTPAPRKEGIGTSRLCSWAKLGVATAKRRPHPTSERRLSGDLRVAGCLIRHGRCPRVDLRHGSLGVSWCGPVAGVPRACDQWGLCVRLALGSRRPRSRRGSAGLARQKATSRSGCCPFSGTRGAPEQLWLHPVGWMRLWRGLHCLAHMPRAQQQTLY